MRTCYDLRMYTRAEACAQSLQLHVLPSTCSSFLRNDLTYMIYTYITYVVLNMLGHDRCTSYKPRASRREPQTPPATSPIDSPDNNPRIKKFVPGGLTPEK